MVVFDLLYRPGDAILFNESFSQINHDRILNNDEAWYDEWLLNPEYQNKKPDVPRNLSTVSTVATENYWSDRDDVIGD